MAEDRRDTIGQVISVLSQFTDKIKWVFNRDLKPRTLFGLKSDGTIVFIGDSDGFPQFTNKKPTLLLTETLSWTVAASKNTADIESEGYRELWVSIYQQWTTVPATVTAQPNYGDENGVRVSDDNDEALVTLTPGNLRATIFPLVYSPDLAAGQSAFPIGDLTTYIRIQFTTTDPSIGSIEVRLWGVR